MGPGMGAGMILEAGKWRSTLQPFGDFNNGQEALEIADQSSDRLATAIWTSGWERATLARPSGYGIW
jgi:hypothetical protein